MFYPVDVPRSLAVLFLSIHISDVQGSFDGFPPKPWKILQQLTKSEFIAGKAGRKRASCLKSVVLARYTRITQ